MGDVICTLALPFPPSVNTYWRNIVVAGRPRTLISEAGRKYKAEVYRQLFVQKQPTAFDARVAVYIRLTMPDRRRRDLDNFLKGLLDALTEAKVWYDDSQIDLLTIERGPVLPPGEAVVEIYRL